MEEGVLMGKDVTHVGRVFVAEDGPDLGHIYAPFNAGLFFGGSRAYQARTFLGFSTVIWRIESSDTPPSLSHCTKTR